MSVLQRSLNNACYIYTEEERWLLHKHAIAQLVTESSYCYFSNSLALALVLLPSQSLTL